MDEPVIPAEIARLNKEMDDQILSALGYDVPGKEHSYQFWRAWAEAGLFRHPTAS